MAEASLAKLFSWMSLDPSDDSQPWFRWWQRWATSHYLSQCWPRPISPCDVTVQHSVLIYLKNISCITASCLSVYWELNVRVYNIFHTWKKLLKISWQDSFNQWWPPVSYFGANGGQRDIFVCGIMTLRARLLGPTWGPSGADRTQVGPMLPHGLCYIGMHHVPPCMYHKRASFHYS